MLPAGWFRGLESRFLPESCKINRYKEPRATKRCFLPLCLPRKSRLPRAVLEKKHFLFEDAWTVNYIPAAYSPTVNSVSSLILRSATICSLLLCISSLIYFHCQYTVVLTTLYISPLMYLLINFPSSKLPPLILKIIQKSKLHFGGEEKISRIDTHLVRPSNRSTWHIYYLRYRGTTSPDLVDIKSRWIKIIGSGLEFNRRV